MKTLKSKSLTGGAGLSVWFIGAGTHEAVGLRKAEMRATTIIDATEVCS